MTETQNIRLLSIVIRTYNEARHLPALLDMIARQETGSVKVETIVVDSGSTDDTLIIAKQHRCRVVHVHRDQFTFGRALNLGCAAAAGEALVFISGHCIPVKAHWLAALMQPLADGHVAYAYGRQIGNADTRFSERQVFAKYYPIQTRIPQRGFFCNNANAVLLCRTWESFHFDEELTGLEDMALAQRLVNTGERIAYAADASVYHLHDETWPQIARRYHREAMALQKIMPEVHVRWIDALRYFGNAVGNDLIKALKQGELFRSFAPITRLPPDAVLGRLARQP